MRHRYQYAPAVHFPCPDVRSALGFLCSDVATGAGAGVFGTPGNKCTY